MGLEVALAFELQVSQLPLFSPQRSLSALTCVSIRARFRLPTCDVSLHNSRVHTYSLVCDGANSVRMRARVGKRFTVVQRAETSVVRSVAHCHNRWKVACGRFAPVKETSVEKPPLRRFRDEKGFRTERSANAQVSLTSFLLEKLPEYAMDDEMAHRRVAEVKYRRRKIPQSDDPPPLSPTRNAQPRPNGGR